MSDGPRDYIDAMVNAIVGIEIGVSRLVGKFKRGQHKEPRDLSGAGEALKSQGDTVIGNAMLAMAARMGGDTGA